MERLLGTEGENNEFWGKESETETGEGGGCLGIKGSFRCGLWLGLESDM